MLAISNNCQDLFKLSHDNSMNSDPLLIYCPREDFGTRIQQTLAATQHVVVTTQVESLLPILAEREFCGIVFDCRRSSSQPRELDLLAWIQRVRVYLRSRGLSPTLFELCDVQEAREITEESYIQVHSVIQLAAELRRQERLGASDQQATKIHDETRDPEIPTASGEERLKKDTLNTFETRSPRFKQMLGDLLIAGAHDVAILLIGETGSGKTYLSKTIHEHSPRSEQPFVHVACGALPRDLIESELFGHMKGSFTSAHADKEGKFVAARQGTILLDEIDVLGPDQQVKLLRVIETGEFEPVGSNTTLRSQARLIFASNLDLEPLVEQGKFRPDLYYRLNMLKFEIPPLRQRRMDIVPLSEKFIEKFQRKHGITVTGMDDSLLDALLSYPWPGNIRELEHVIQRAVIYCRDGILRREQLPAHIVNGQVGPANDPSIRLGRSAIAEVDQTLCRQVEVSERDIIEQALNNNNFSRTNTAKELGISRVTLYNKMKKYDMLKT